MTEDDDLNNVRYKANYRYDTKLTYEEQAARIKVLEKALVKADKDYEKLKETVSALTNGK